MTKAQPGWPPPEAGQRLFDRSGHLTPACHERICKRLIETGHWSPMRQSEILARQLGYASATEIWAILMWNAQPCPALADMLGRWIRSGMPLNRGGNDDTHAPLAKAS